MFMIQQASPLSLGPVLNVAQPAPWEAPLISPYRTETIASPGPMIMPAIEIFAPTLVGRDQQNNQPKNRERIEPSTISELDKRPHLPTIAILIDDLGYSRQGMNASLALPVEVALAILPSTPFALQTARTAQQQKRMTLLHAPMENQRALKLGPGGLYAAMSEHELKAMLNESLDSLPGIQGANNHMGSLLTTNAQSMKWVMEVLQGRSMFFIDSLTSPDSVARRTAEEYGLKTVSRDVFLDNLRTEQAIDKQFTRLLKLARRHGSALAIGHPYAETTRYLSKRLARMENDGVRLVPLSSVLAVRANKALVESQ
ncbi:divergent polysaccharide deacetylase family protein [Marinomonas sp. IMCC 4694]|nr:divergent polysaccharide deacetylase family protein [Marinomonas sp. IMCC 4694]